MDMVQLTGCFNLFNTVKEAYHGESILSMGDMCNISCYEIVELYSL